MKETRTLVELYDPDTHIYNAMGVMLLRPRHVAFIVPEHARAVYNKYRDAYLELWESRGCVPENVESILTATSDIHALSDAISQFAGEGVTLDIEGGTPELYLAAGYVYGQNPGGFSCIRIDFADAKITEYSAVGASVRKFTAEERARVAISVPECIRIYGGSIDRDSTAWLRASMTRRQIDDDVMMMWRAMLRRSRHTWNTVVPDKFHPTGEGSLNVYVNGNDEKIGYVRALVDDLVSAGALLPRGQNGTRRIYKCKSRVVLSCLRKAGELLELYMNSIACEISGDDAVSGVCLSFDGEEGSSDNEIDGIFTLGCLPVFISCKNGHVGSDELYKFAAVTSQFGGDAKISILVAPSLNAPGGDITPRRIKAVRERAELYRVKIISDIYDISRREAAAELRRLCKM